MPKSIGVKSESYHMKEHRRLTQTVKFERDWRREKSMACANKRAYPYKALLNYRFSKVQLSLRLTQ